MHRGTCLVLASSGRGPLQQHFVPILHQACLLRPPQHHDGILVTILCFLRIFQQTIFQQTSHEFPSHFSRTFLGDQLLGTQHHPRQGFQIIPRILLYIIPKFCTHLQEVTTLCERSQLAAFLLGLFRGILIQARLLVAFAIDISHNLAQHGIASSIRHAVVMQHPLRTTLSSRSAEHRLRLSRRHDRRNHDSHLQLRAQTGHRRRDIRRIACKRKTHIGMGLANDSIPSRPASAIQTMDLVGLVVRAIRRPPERGHATMSNHVRRHTVIAPESMPRLIATRALLRTLDPRGTIRDMLDRRLHLVPFSAPLHRRRPHTFPDTLQVVHHSLRSIFIRQELPQTSFRQNLRH